MGNLCPFFELFFFLFFPTNDGGVLHFFVSFSSPQTTGEYCIFFFEDWKILFVFPNLFVAIFHGPLEHFVHSLQFLNLV